MREKLQQSYLPIADSFHFRIPYGNESGDGLNTENCRDCDVLPGEMHDLGCCIERCPVCGGQLISCTCVKEDV